MYLMKMILETRRAHVSAIVGDTYIYNKFLVVIFHTKIVSRYSKFLNYVIIDKTKVSLLALNVPDEDDSRNASCAPFCNNS